MSQGTRNSSRRRLKLWSLDKNTIACTLGIPAIEAGRSMRAIAIYHSLPAWNDNWRQPSYRNVERNSNSYYDRSRRLRAVRGKVEGGRKRIGADGREAFGRGESPREKI